MTSNHVNLLTAPLAGGYYRPYDNTIRKFLQIYPSREQRCNMLEYSKLVRSQYPNAQNGDMIITCSLSSKCNNNNTYHYVDYLDSEQCVYPLCYGADYDDYGFSNPKLKINSNQPIDLFCLLNVRNNYWWPSDELRSYLKTLQLTKVYHTNCGKCDDYVQYVDVMSDNHVFRFFIQKNSDLSEGLFCYCPEEFESNTGHYFIECKDLPSNMVLCKVMPKPESIFEDDEDDEDDEEENENENVKEENDENEENDEEENDENEENDEEENDEEENEED